MAGEGSYLLPLPWICFSLDRLEQYTKLAFVPTDPTVDKDLSRKLQVQFLMQAPELKHLLLNGPELPAPTTQPNYAPMVTQLTVNSNRQPPNIFADMFKEEETGWNIPTALSQEDLDRDMKLISTLGGTLDQITHNKAMEKVKRENEDKFQFRPQSQRTLFKHTTPQKVTPGMASSRQHIVVKDFRDVIHSLAGMDLEKKDMPGVWFKLIKSLKQCTGATKTGFRERDAALYPHCLAFMMKMCFNLTHVLNQISELSQDGGISVRSSQQENFGSLLKNFHLSRDLLSQFEREFHEFSQKSTWTDLSVFEKKQKVAEFYHHFCLTNSASPRMWRKGDYSIYMSAMSTQLWTQYFNHLPLFQSTTSKEPRATVQNRNTNSRNPRPKGVNTRGLTNFQDFGPKGRGRGRRGRRGRGRRGRIPKNNRKKKKKNKRGKRGRGNPQQPTIDIKEEK